MIKIDDVCQFMDQRAPRRLAEGWDNVGLLVGDRNAALTKVLTCLTVTPESVREAVEGNYQLVISHHPFPFKGMKKITFDTINGQMLHELIANKIAVYSSHTAFDSTLGGINEMILRELSIDEPNPIQLNLDQKTGSGRIGKPAKTRTVSQIINDLKSLTGASEVRLVGSPDDTPKKIAVGCGSGGDFLDKAMALGCGCFITGEMSFHSLLAAKARNVSVILLGHYSSEKFAMNLLAKEIDQHFEDIEALPSLIERDPLTTH